MRTHSTSHSTFIPPFISPPEGLHLVVGRLAHLVDPSSYAGQTFDSPGRSNQARQVESERPEKESPPFLCLQIALLSLFLPPPLYLSIPALLETAQNSLIVLTGR